MIGIYKFTNKYDRKVYIGKSKCIEKRYDAHVKTSLKTNGKTHWEHALQKYSIDSFDFDILIECPKEYLNYWEKFYIKYYGANNRDYGYNMTEGGDGISFWSEELLHNHSIIHLGQPGAFKGKHHTEETKQHLREIGKGRKPSRESVEKRKRTMEVNGHPFKGKHHTEESKEKNRKAHIGKHVSPETEWKKGHEPWNKGKHGYHNKKKRKKLTLAQCKNISDGKQRAKLLKTEEEIQQLKIIQSETTSNYWKIPEWREHQIAIRKGKPSKIKGKHKVWDDETHTKYHYE